jgi:hypothetical protein
MAAHLQTGTEGFTLTVLRSDSPAVVMFPVAASPGDFYAGAQSTCGAVIRSVELRPNPSATGAHQSQSWQLRSVSYAR